MFPRYFLAAILGAGSLARADVTLRQTMQMQSHLAPPGAAAGAIPGANGPTEILVRVKGNRAYSRFGALAFITDASLKQVTLLDAAGQRFATTSLADYTDRLKKLASGGQENIPEAARKLMAGIQVHVESHDTGGSDTIMGIQAQSSEVDLSMTIPMPMGGRGGGGLEVTGKFECWKPASGESQRLPALRELMAWYNLAESQGVGAASMMGQMFSGMPGIGDRAAALAAEMAKGGSLTLRMHGAFFMPGLSAIIEQAKNNGASLPDMPGIATPLFEVTTELVEINSDPVADADLMAPSGYQPAPVDDLLKLLLPAAKR